MSGQLERCEREWHELEGEFQELQVGPGHLVAQLLSAFPFLLTQPGRWGPSGPWGLPLARHWGLVVRVGQHPPISQHFSSSSTWGARSKLPITSPSHRLFAPRTSFSAESWSVASEGKFQVCHVGEARGGQICAGTHRTAQPPSPQGSPLTASVSTCFWQLNFSSILAGQPSLLQLHFERCAWELFT